MDVPARLPYLTADLPGVGGRLRERLEDFIVEELPLYRPSGRGEHTYLFVEIAGISSAEAVRRVAGVLGLPERSFGKPLSPR